MSFSFLLIPIFFVALVIWVAWPLLAEGSSKAAPVRSPHPKAKKKQSH